MQVFDMQIRHATPADLPAINAIYNHYVLHSTCTYQLEAETNADRLAWFERHGAAHPVIVAEQEHRVVGWGSLSPYRTREAYRRTVENSVYVRQGCQRQGIGSRLLADLITRATAIGHHAIIAGIDSEQVGSLVLHVRHGFVEVGRLREVGFKHGRWLDVVYMERLVAGAPGK
ncbi:MAG: N-acetyltransferase family protein [bacterium]